jgi:predicted MFS family arabinose efflux permease
VLLAMSIATILGTLAYGFVERRLDRRRGPVLVGSLGAVVALLLLALLPAPSAATAAALLTLFAALAATYPLIMAQGRRFLADAEVGRGLTFLNGTCFLGAASIQLASGLVLDVARQLGKPPPTAYGWLFLSLGGLLALVIAAYSRSSDSRRNVA